ncbi:hypothetical protein NDI56_00170 [Haloarcula sp. S1CR25-12]|uniref:DUF4157 domain-containing protein n=1 Tax=Haloarcula saliterrae TaxID=2950534 RepID=A0ABU2F7H2_9EURY|nr:hypothetical protein [Haloarcula sp. S1CR25-12]MDS0257815.1 hypothetical protein [Haloarcula sp. S1CR25-12]
MSRDRVGPTVAVAALLVLAGCAGVPLGGSGDTTASPTGADDPGTPDGSPSAPVENTVAVENGTLPVNATLTYARVQALMGSDTDPWPVRVRNLSEWRASVQRVGASPLNRALGFENVSTDWSEPTGVTVNGAVYVHPGDGSPEKTERVLAHEFAHLVQYRTTMLPWQGRLSQPRPTTDWRNTRRALSEGGAVFVADAYADRYLGVQSNSAYARGLYRNGSATYRSALAPYVFGSQYVAHRIDDPANLSAAYETYPRTTEQVVHNETPAEEPPANLSVRASGSDSWTYLGNNTLGELATRAALDTELDRERAAAAASGWGDDRLTIFRNATDESRYGWVWVMRWDNESETDELRAALLDYTYVRGQNSDAAFGYRKLDDTTVAVVFGDPGFTARADVRATDDDVSVSVDES